MEEGRDMGISRRIKAVPKGFKVGETWVAVGHIEAIPGGYVTDFEKQGLCLEHEPNAKGTACKRCKAKKEKGKPAIFQVFRPTAIEYVVKGTESEKELEAIEERGIKLVQVIEIKEEKKEPEQSQTSPAT